MEMSEVLFFLNSWIYIEFCCFCSHSICHSINESSTHWYYRWPYHFCIVFLHLISAEDESVTFTMSRAPASELSELFDAYSFLQDFKVWICSKCCRLDDFQWVGIEESEIKKTLVMLLLILLHSACAWVKLLTFVHRVKNIFETINTCTEVQAHPIKSAKIEAMTSQPNNTV